MLVLDDGERLTQAVSVSVVGSQGPLTMYKASDARDYLVIRPSYFAPPGETEYLVTVRSGNETTELRGTVEIAERPDASSVTLHGVTYSGDVGRIWVTATRSGNVDLPLTVRMDAVPGLTMTSADLVIPGGYRRYTTFVEVQVHEDFEAGATLPFEVVVGTQVTKDSVILELDPSYAPFEDLLGMVLDIQGEGIVQWSTGDAARPREWRWITGLPEIPLRLEGHTTGAIGYSVVAIDGRGVSVTLTQDGHDCSETYAGTDAWGQDYWNWICRAGT